MKFIKFLTRKYTLLEHSLITESLFKKNTSIPGIYYKECLEISRNGLIDIYATKDDFKRNKKWVIKSAENPRLIETLLKKGLRATKKLSQLPASLLIKIHKLTDKEILEELMNLRRKFFDYSGYIDFTIYLGDSGVKLSKKNIEAFSLFHEYRKKVFMNYFKFLRKICRKIAQKKNIKFGDLSFLSFSEVVKFFNNKLTLQEIDKLQKARSKHYVAVRSESKETIISDDFEKEVKKFQKYILKEKAAEIIKGIGINKGIVKGRVQIINQTTPLNQVAAKKIIVTQMTSPNMTLILKKSLAIITDEGGLLCHAANVAREFGVLAIIGTKNATRILKNNDLVEVNTKKGIVIKLKK